MRITVLGAAGNVGSRVVKEALSRGHQVTGVMRDAKRLGELHPDIKQEVGDAANIDDVVRLSQGQDLLISATRPQPGNEQELVNMTQSLLAGAAQSGVRLLLVGGAGGLTVPGKPDQLVVDDPTYVAPVWRDIALACTKQLALCRANTQTNWTYLSPPAMLMPGERTGKFRLGLDELLTDKAGNSAISMEDYAIALMDEAEQGNHQRARFTVAY